MTKYGKVTIFSLGPKSRDTYLLVLYAAVATFFFYVISLNQRNYQDVWILDGIAVPTVIFIYFSLFVELLVHENRKVVIFTAFFLFAMSLIPGLKYQLFCGCYDSPLHFRFTDAIVSLGSVPETEFYSKSYGGNPGMHILMSCISIVSGISVNDVFKFVIPAVLSIVPYIIYFITKDLLSDAIQRYAIIASSFPIIAAYVVSGTNLGMIPYLLLIAIFLRRVLRKMHTREFWLLVTVTGFSLIISHAVTALFVAFLLIGTLLILKSLEMTGMKSFLSRFPASTSLVTPLSYVVLLFTWWIFISTFNLDTLAGYIRTLFTGVVAPIPMRFYQIPLLAQLQILTVFHLGYFVMGVLSLFGLFIFLRKSTREEFSNETQAIYMHLIILLSIVLLFLSFQFVSRFGAVQYTRFIDYAIPLCSPLAGLTLWRFNRFLCSLNVAWSKIKIRNLVFASFLFVLVSCCLIQFFPCQPLVPRANVLSSDLPENEYIDDIGSINTIYQIKMISFAETYCSNVTITSDSVTMLQIWGFSNHSFYLRRIRENPLTTNQDQNVEWNLFLFHTSKAGPLHERVEYRTKGRIEDLRLKVGNVIYDNGESFIISR